VRKNAGVSSGVNRRTGREQSWWTQRCEQLGGITAEEWLAQEYPHRKTVELAEELASLFNRKVSCSGIRAGDFHIPLHDPKLIEKMVYVSQKMNSKKLIVAGDFYNLDAFSKFVSEPTYFAGEELDYGEQILDYLVEWFDSILLLMGNHEERLYKRRLDKEIDIERLNRMLHRHEDKIKFSKYGYCVLNDTWRITHPKNYSQIKTRVANRLALKHRQHVLNFHGHALSIAHDDSGHQIIADGGGLFDEKKMEYRMIKDSIYPAWARGFWVITGQNELHAFNNLFTPWAFYEKCWQLQEGDGMNETR